MSMTDIPRFTYLDGKEADTALIVLYLDGKETDTALIVSYLDGKETDTALIVLLFVSMQTPPPTVEMFLSVRKTQ